MSKRVEFWFDFSCPYAYFGSTQIEALAARCGAELDLRPMLLGGVFRARGTPQKLFAHQNAPKLRHNAIDLQRSARVFGAPYQMPPGHPFRTVTALRSLLVVGPPYQDLMHDFYRAYWAEGRDLGQDEVVASILAARGLDAVAILEKTQDAEVKAELRRRIDEAIERGVFGAPACFVDGQLYWGQDRFDLVERALGHEPVEDLPQSFVHPVEVWFDYSSPFAYLGVMRAHRIFGTHARYRPFLLGGVFKALGTANVPFFEQNEAKQRHTQADLHRRTQLWQVPFSWPSRFPMNTVKPLRATLAAEEQCAPDDERLVHLRESLFAAYWADDLDVSASETIGARLEACGFDADRALARIQQPDMKAILRTNTEEAMAQEIFGAPTVVVQREQQRQVYWGSDRVHFAAHAAAGDVRFA